MLRPTQRGLSDGAGEMRHPRDSLVSSSNVHDYALLPPTASQQSFDDSGHVGRSALSVGEPKLNRQNLCSFSIIKATLLKFAGCIGALLLVIVLYQHIDMATVQSYVSYYKEHRAVGLPLFLLLNTVMVMIFCPGVIPQILAGAIFGFTLGAPVAWLGTVAGQSASFAVGRFLFREPLAAYIEAQYPKLGAVEAAIFAEDQPWKMLFLMRLAPIIPDSIMNYSLAVSSVQMGTFMWVSAVALAPYSILYAYIGSVSSNVADAISGKAQMTPEERSRQAIFTVISLLIGLVAVVYIVVAVKRALAKVMARAEARGMHGVHRDRTSSDDGVAHDADTETHSLLGKPGMHSAV